jgi:type IV pilus assembly protein PilA
VADIGIGRFQTIRTDCFDSQPNQRGTAVNIIAKLRARRDGDESGFTLIELMVVVLIIAILIAIAIPTFLGARQRAQDKAAQSSLRNSLTAAKTIYTDGEDYTLATVDSTATHTLKDTEPSLSFVTTAVTSATDGPKVVSVGATADQIVLAAVSKGGTCFAMRDTVAPAASAGTEFAKVTGACSATNAATMTTWSPDGW